MLPHFSIPMSIKRKKREIEKVKEMGRLCEEDKRRGCSILSKESVVKAPKSKLLTLSLIFLKLWLILSPWVVISKLCVVCMYVHGWWRVIFLIEGWKKKSLP